MSIIGLDLSLTQTGLVRLENGKPYFQRLIKTKPAKNPKMEIRRLMQIGNEISDELKEDTKIAVIEGISFMSRHTVSLAQLAGLSYLVRWKLDEKKIPFIIVAPSTLKKFITGKGNAQKDVMMMETYKRYHVTLTNDNLCDAYGLAKIGEAILDETVKLTKPQQEVIDLLKKQLV